MIWRRQHTPTDRDLAAFADGSLPAARRGQVEQALSESPQLRSAVAAQRQVLRTIDAAAGERAPSSLRARVALAQPPPRRVGPSRLAGALGTVVVGAGAAAVVAVVVVVGGGTAAPTVAQASVLTSRAPQTAVAEPVVDQGTLPGVRAVGLTYPDWEDHFGYRARGVRRDSFNGRLVTTVFYTRGASQVAYEIVSGSPLRQGGIASITRLNGVKLWSMATPAGRAVSWLRDGHMCILIGSNTSQSALQSLAAWREGGREPYIRG
jgi:hypothetical protein